MADVESLQYGDSREYEVLEDFPVSGTGKTPEPAVLQETGQPSVYDIANSVLGTRIIRISEAFPADSTAVQGDC
jgi:hypothetical protein